MRALPWPVVLASASPRRQSLLRGLVQEFTVDPADLDEDALADPDPFVTAQRLAREKALVVSQRHSESLVVAGDTVVAFEAEGGWRQLAKPSDGPDACRMLDLLQGRTHTVITGVCLRWPGGLSCFTDSSRVTFRKVTAAEIQEYVATGEPLDKAGAYGLQGLGKNFVEKIEGEVDTVVGLPTKRLAEALESLAMR